MRGEAWPRSVCVACEVMYPPLDEGVRIYASCLARSLSAGREVLLLSEREGRIGEIPVHAALTNRYFRSPALGRALRSFDPDAIVYVPWTSLTSRTLLRAWSLRRYSRRSAIGVVALQPRSVDVLTRAASFLDGPDLVLATGPGAESQARRLGLPCARVGAGVDTQRFRPATQAEREELRRRAGLDPSAWMVLHVGHLKPSRNIGVLAEAARLPGVACAAVGSSSIPAQDGLVRSLSAAGVTVVTGHQPRIEDWYRMSDAYLFPVTSALDAIELPLSVLEAAACGLEILATPFGGLPDLFPDGSVHWTRSDREVIETVKRLALREGPPAGGARRHVEGMIWDRVAAQVAAALRACPRVETARR